MSIETMSTTFWPKQRNRKPKPIVPPAKLNMYSILDKKGREVSQWPGLTADSALRQARHCLGQYCRSAVLKV
jgi:hypothetical protein